MDKWVNLGVTGAIVFFAGQTAGSFVSTAGGTRILAQLGGAAFGVWLARQVL